MRGRTLIISLAAMLSVLLIASVFLEAGVVDVTKVSFLNAQVPLDEPTASSATLAMNPSVYLNHSKVVGQTVSLGVDVSGPVDMNLYAWQLNITWGKDVTKGTDVLNLIRIVPGSFLNSPKLTSSEELGGSVINVTDNGARCSCSTETILGDTHGVNNTGRLANAMFQVVGIGSIEIKINTVGTLRTMLLDNNGDEITVTGTTNCYFRNRKIGDVDNDGNVDFDDFSLISAHYAFPAGPLGYDRECDFEGAFNGYVDFDDFSLLSAWYTFPKGPLDP